MEDKYAARLWLAVIIAATITLGQLSACHMHSRHCMLEAIKAGASAVEAQVAFGVGSESTATILANRNCEDK